MWTRIILRSSESANNVRDGTRLSDADNVSLSFGTSFISRCMQTHLYISSNFEPFNYVLAPDFE